MKRKNSKGFTLIELLVVVAIIGVLASVVLASLNSARHKAKVAKVQTEVNQIYKAFYASVIDAGVDYFNKSDTVGQYTTHADYSMWYVPDCATTMDITGNDRPNGEFARQWATVLNVYMKTIPLDPWGQPYWVDAAYQCTAGEVAGCTAGAWYYVIGSSGPNNSLPNAYDSDNVVTVFCKHP